MKVLKINIYQPQAHYRVPFTYQRRHTYPLPPYSTVKGFLCNVLGIKDENDDSFKKLTNELCLSISGRFESKTTEYIWLRNLSKERHIARYGVPGNRTINGHIAHIGGQNPASIDILNDVDLTIHIYHKENDFLDRIKSALNNPEDRNEPLHLGRAEDWIVLDREAVFIDLKQTTVFRGFYRFFWIPKEYAENNNPLGIAHRLPTFYTIVNGIRNFTDYIDVYLNEGKIVDLSCYFDNKESLPVFFASLKMGGI